MKIALCHERLGRFDIVKRPLPAPGPGEAVVRINASGLNPLDAKIRAGAAPHARHPLPSVLGLDLAGVVTALGTEVTNLKEGDEVYGMTGGVGGLQGSLAEYAVVDARLLAHKPRRLSMRQAAAMPLVMITAWEGLVDRAAIKPGQKLLVHGGAGGVGNTAIQLALSMGARVYATDSAGNAGIIEQTGAVPIDYDAMSVDDYVARFTDGEGFDVVFDTVGGAVLDASFQAVRRFGHVVSALGWGTHSLAPLSMKGATYSGVFTLLPLLTGTGREHHGEILRDAAALADQGKLTPLLDSRTFTLQTLDAAFDLLDARRNTGKLVVEIV